MGIDCDCDISIGCCQGGLVVGNEQFDRFQQWPRSDQALFEQPFYIQSKAKFSGVQKCSLSKGVELRPVTLLVAMWAVWRGGGGSREMGHEGRCNVHLGGLGGGVGRKLAVSEVRMGELHLCHAIGWS